MNELKGLLNDGRAAGKEASGERDGNRRPSLEYNLRDEFQFCWQLITHWCMSVGKELAKRTRGRLLGNTVPLRINILRRVLRFATTIIVAE